MASFELNITKSCDGNIKYLSRAILIASKISRDGLLELTPKKLRLCTNTDMFFLKFVFYKSFFSSYNCGKKRESDGEEDSDPEEERRKRKKEDERHRCYINLKALLGPFKPIVLMAERESGSELVIACSLEPDVNNQIVFRIDYKPVPVDYKPPRRDDPEQGRPSVVNMKYRIPINDLDTQRMEKLDAINRTYHYARAEISPKQSKKERFLLSAFNSFAPDIDQVAFRTSASEVKFIGSISLQSDFKTTSEFTHKKEDFSVFDVKEEMDITVPLRCLKLFLTFVENNRVQTFPKYVFEGVGQPAHFIYDTSVYKGHFVSQTLLEMLPVELDAYPLPIEANESFMGEDDVILPEEQPDNFLHIEYNVEGEDDEEDGYNDNESESSDYIDGNLDGLNATVGNLNISTHNASIFGAESIRSEMSEMTYDPEKVREVLDLDNNPDDIENVKIEYSDDSDLGDD